MKLEGEEGALTSRNSHLPPSELLASCHDLSEMCRALPWEGMCGLWEHPKIVDFNRDKVFWCQMCAQFSKPKVLPGDCAVVWDVREWLEPRAIAWLMMDGGMDVMDGLDTWDWADVLRSSCMLTGVNSVSWAGTMTAVMAHGGCSYYSFEQPHILSPSWARGLLWTPRGV